MPTSHLNTALVALLALLAPPTAHAPPDAGQFVARSDSGAGTKGPIIGS